MNYYETILIFDGRIEDDKYKPCADHYIKKITDLGGLIRKIDRLGKKKLAYEIKGIKDGWYAIFTYKAKPELIPELEKAIRIDDTVIKFLTIRRDPEEDELEEYAEVEEIPGDHPAESESEQNPSGIKPETDCWNMIFNFEEVS